MSITFLAFDRRLPIAREIAAYQKLASSASAATTRPTRLPGARLAPLGDRRVGQYNVIRSSFAKCSRIRTTDCGPVTS